MKNISPTLAFVVLMFVVFAEGYTRFCNGIWQPAPGTSWMWQIKNTPSTKEIDASGVDVVDIDMQNTPTSLIDYIHSKNKVVICYIDTAYEPGRTDSSTFENNPSVIGKDLVGWPGQHWVDIRSQVVKDIMKSRASTALSKGCDAIEWDDVDAYANDSGFNLTSNDQFNFNKYLADMTHGLGMSVGLKNDLDQVKQLVSYFDWALNEECYALNECDLLDPFVAAGKAVFGTEYPKTNEDGSTSSPTPNPDPNDFCPKLNNKKFSWLMSSLELDGTGVTKCCTYQSPACPSIPSKCTATSGTPSTPTTPSTPSPTGKTTPSPTVKPTPTPTSEEESAGENNTEHLPSAAVSVVRSCVLGCVAVLAVFLLVA